MFHKVKTEAERQKIFDEYLLGILKQKNVIKINKKIIDESGFSFDPNKDNQQLKGAFNNYFDTLVVKNYIIEQLLSRLKISKSLSTQFVNELKGNQILILSKNLNDFIKYIDDNHNNINDYILMSSFDNLQKDYNITLQQEKIKKL
jgi:endo-1,4-beta-mannosidase